MKDNKDITHNKDIKKLKVSILLTIFVVLFSNFLTFLAYSGSVEVNNFILALTITLNLFFIIISLLYFIFVKRVVSIQSLFNLYLGGVFALTSLNDLFITIDMFFQMLSFSKFLNTITVLIIIYISIVLFFLICAKNKLNNNRRNKILLIIVGLFIVILSTIKVRILEYAIIGFGMYIFPCIFTFGFYQIYIFIYYHKKRKE